MRMMRWDDRNMRVLRPRLSLNFTRDAAQVFLGVAAFGTYA